MTMGKDTKSLQARTAAKQQRETVRLGGLKSCRLAAGLTQKELAERVGSNQTTLADLENWDKADTRITPCSGRRAGASLQRSKRPSWSSGKTPCCSSSRRRSSSPSPDA